MTPGKREELRAWLKRSEERLSIDDQYMPGGVSLSKTALLELLDATEPGMPAALIQIAALVRAWKDGDEPEGAPSSRRTLLAIEELLTRPLGMLESTILEPKRCKLCGKEQPIDWARTGWFGDYCTVKHFDMRGASGVVGANKP